MELQRKFYMVITFRIKGYPYANTTWYKNNKLIQVRNEGKYREYMIQYRAMIDGHLEIQMDTTASNGVYTLVATNQYGTVNKSINVVFNTGTRPVTYFRDLTLCFHRDNITCPTSLPSSPPFYWRTRKI